MDNQSDQVDSGLEAAFGSDRELFMFFITWIKKHMNAKAAYQELHPKVGEGSAAVLGSRMLRKVKFEVLLSVYGLSVETYISQLKEGLNTTKWNEFTGEKEPDHKTRRQYHEVLGKLLGIENKDDKPENKTTVFKPPSWYKPRGSINSNPEDSNGLGSS